MSRGGEDRDGQRGDRLTVPDSQCKQSEEEECSFDLFMELSVLIHIGCRLIRRVDRKEREGEYSRQQKRNGKLSLSG